MQSAVAAIGGRCGSRYCGVNRLAMMHNVLVRHDESLERHINIVEIYIGDKAVDAGALRFIRENESFTAHHCKQPRTGLIRYYT
jgi:hypothetical protein